MPLLKFKKKISYINYFFLFYLSIVKLGIKKTFSNIKNKSLLNSIKSFSEDKSIVISVDLLNQNIFHMPLIVYFYIYNYGFKIFIKKLLMKIKRKIYKEPIKSNIIEKSIPYVDDFSVLFIVGCPDCASCRYRVHNVIEYLLPYKNIKTKIIQHYKILDYIDKLSDFNIIYYSRIASDKNVELMIDEGKKRNIINIYEIDDLVFDETKIKYVDAIKGWNKDEISSYVNGVMRYQKLLKSCDYFIGSNDYLARSASRYNPNCYVIRNALNSIQINNSKEALFKSAEEKLILNSEQKQTIIVGYFSGTQTHDKDFKEAENAILRILEKYKQVNLYLWGPLHINITFLKYKDRVIRRSFVPWQQLPYEIARIDINIAPLELNNPYCDSKSELKYFESALLKKPTVASPTFSFKEAIRNGENGFLASNEQDWFQYLEELILNKSKRESIGEAAYSHTLKKYTHNFMSVHTNKVFNNIIMDYRKNNLKISDKAKVISWIVPSINAGSGGLRTIFVFANLLRQFGHVVKIYVDDEEKNVKTLETQLHDGYGKCDFEILPLLEQVSKCDALIATHWTTVNRVLTNKKNFKEAFYFIQDYEPYFYPVSTNYILAENSYKAGLNCISYNSWCAHLLKRNFNIEADIVPFFLDRSIYYRRPYIKREPKKVVAFARPEMPRRCYALVLSILNNIYKLDPSIDIVIYGSDELNSSQMDFKHENLKLIKVLDELAELYSAGTLGIAISTTNPSLIPYEMMLCGLPVVDFDYNENLKNYGSQDNVFLMNPIPKEIARLIVELLNDQEALNKVRNNALQFVSEFPERTKSARILEKIILNKLVDPIVDPYVNTVL